MKIFFLLFISSLFIACSSKKVIPAQKIETPELIFPEIHYDKPPFKKVPLEKVGAHLGAPIYMRIFKAEEILELWVKVGKKYKLYNTYPIEKTSGVLGPKEYEGDRQNPEGVYLVNIQRLNRFSKYHLAINIGYPNKLDRSLGRTGSNIMIHGSNKSIGCFAMGDAAIEDIYPIVYTALDLKQKYFQVAIYPFIMSEQNMQDYQLHPWYPFWENLKEGYDIFEKEKVPPKVSVKDGRYIFKSAH